MDMVGAIATVVLVGLAVWFATRRPYDKAVRRAPRPVCFVDVGREKHANRGLLARIRLVRRARS